MKKSMLLARPSLLELSGYRKLKENITLDDKPVHPYGEKTEELTSKLQEVIGMLEGSIVALQRHGEVQGLKDARQMLMDLLKEVDPYEAETYTSQLSGETNK